MNAPPVRQRLYIVWIVFAVLCAGIVVHEATGIFQPTPPKHTGRQPMFAFHEPALGRVEIRHQGQTTALIRDATGTWFHHGSSHDHDHDHGHGDHRHADTVSPRAAYPMPASTAIAERIELITHMLVDRRVKPEQSLDHYGLMNPQTTIVFYRRKGTDIVFYRRKGADGSQPLATLHVGDLLPSQYAYYTMQPGDQELSLIPRYYIALFLALVFGEDQAPTPLPVQAEKG